MKSNRWSIHGSSIPVYTYTITRVKPLNLKPNKDLAGIYFDLAATCPIDHTKHIVSNYVTTENMYS